MMGPINADGDDWAGCVFPREEAFEFAMGLRDKSPRNIQTATFRVDFTDERWHPEVGRESMPGAVG